MKLNYHSVQQMVCVGALLFSTGQLLESSASICLCIPGSSQLTDKADGLFIVSMFCKVMFHWCCAMCERYI